MAILDLPRVKTFTVTVRATLITGHDSRGNEFFYFRSVAGWHDGYNERPADPDYIRRHVYPNVTQVRFPLSGGLSHTMSRNEWIEAGCPLDLTREQVEMLIDTAPHPVDEAQRIEREIDSAVSAESDWKAQAEAKHADCLDEIGRRYDFTQTPRDMPNINFDDVDEIQF